MSACSQGVIGIALVLVVSLRLAGSDTPSTSEPCVALDELISLGPVLSYDDVWSDLCNVSLCELARYARHEQGQVPRTAPSRYQLEFWDDRWHAVSPYRPRHRPHSANSATQFLSSALTPAGGHQSHMWLSSDGLPVVLHRRRAGTGGAVHRLWLTHCHTLHCDEAMTYVVAEFQMSAARETGLPAARGALGAGNTNTVFVYQPQLVVRTYQGEQVDRMSTTTLRTGGPTDQKQPLALAVGAADDDTARVWALELRADSDGAQTCRLVLYRCRTSRCTESSVTETELALSLDNAEEAPRVWHMYSDPRAPLDHWRLLVYSSRQLFLVRCHLTPASLECTSQEQTLALGAENTILQAWLVFSALTPAPVAMILTRLGQLYVCERPERHSTDCYRQESVWSPPDQPSVIHAAAYVLDAYLRPVLYVARDDGALLVAQCADPVCGAVWSEYHTRPLLLPRTMDTGASFSALSTYQHSVMLTFRRHQDADPTLGLLWCAQSTCL